MFKRKTRRAAAALLAFSLLTAGASFQLPFVNNNVIVAEAAIDPNTYARDYGYYTNTSNMKGHGITKDWLFAFNNSKPDEVYLESYGGSGNTITIPSKLGKKTVKGVSRDITVYGNVTNIEIDYTQMANDSYFNLVRAVLPKITNLKQINGETIIDDYGNINTDASKNARYFLSRLNSEDNIAISNAMVNYIRALANTIIQEKHCRNDYEKVKALHDWVIYEHEYGGSTYSYGDWCVFMNPQHQALCDGFARAYTLLLQFSGFEAYYEGFKNHAATIVKVYGNYYHVDPSNDAQPSNKKGHEDSLKNDNDPIWFKKHSFPSDYTPKEDEQIAINGDRKYIIRRPSKLYTSNLYQNHKWTHWNDYKTIIKCDTALCDLNGDNKFDQTDVARLRGYISKRIRYEEFDNNARKFLDFNNDGYSDSIDLFDMQSFLDSLVNFNNDK